MAGGIGPPVVVRLQPRADAPAPQRVSAGNTVDILFIDPRHQLRPKMIHPDQTKPHH